MYEPKPYTSAEAESICKINLTPRRQMGLQKRPDVFAAFFIETEAQMANKNLRNLVLTALFVAIGLYLPFLTGQIPQIGSMLLPMHIPVLLCGFVCGAPMGLVAGFITPLMRSSIFGMPYMYPAAIGMAFELAAYGFFSGLIYTHLPKKRSSIYIALVSAMIIGRVIWGIARYVLTFFGKSMFSVSIFIADGFIGAIPGIILQLVLIPVLVYILEKQNFTAKS